MMTNLFSVFDPSSAILSTSWLVTPMVILILPNEMWKVSSPVEKMKSKLVETFKKEVSFSLGKKEKSSEMMIMTVFLTIFAMNFAALYPQVFSPTSHVTVTLPLSLTFWLALMMFGWTKNTNHMLSHLLPQGTPGALMMFMVMIEMVSNIIRPITLCVRLTANLIAGHLLMSLLGSAMLNVQMVMNMTLIPIPILLTILESAVAGIQAYVFMTLITLYTTEVK